MAIFKYVDDFLPGRNPNDLFFIVLDPVSNEKFTWCIEDVLDEINRDRSAKWSNYTKDNWFDGWKSWCEDDGYVMLSIEENGDIVYNPFSSRQV